MRLNNILNQISEKKLFSYATLYISKSTCIYENLAFEEWLFQNHNLETNGDAILLWSNTPAIVIGRYQNPFIESNVKYCEKNKIQLARRYSGGGAVYHDLGNLNISILTTQKNHNRQRSLILIAHYLNLYYSKAIKVVSNIRDDLIFCDSGCKISGSAARISNNRAYHHLTLLINVSIETLNTALNSNLKQKIITNATKSFKANSVGFINQRVPNIKVTDVKKIVIEAFQNQYRTSNLILWKSQFNFPEKSKLLHKKDNDKFLTFINNYDLLKSEEWIFNKSPEFKVTFPYSNNVFEIIVNKGFIKKSLHPNFLIGNSFYQAYKLSKFY